MDSRTFGRLGALLCSGFLVTTVLVWPRARSEEDIVYIEVKDHACTPAYDDPACGGVAFQCWDVRGGSCAGQGSYGVIDVLPLHPSGVPSRRG